MRPALEIAKRMSVSDPEWMAATIEMAARKAGVSLAMEGCPRGKVGERPFYKRAPLPDL